MNYSFKIMIIHVVSSKQASTMDFSFKSPTLMVVEQPRGRFTYKTPLYTFEQSLNIIIPFGVLIFVLAPHLKNKIKYIF